MDGGFKIDVKILFWSFYFSIDTCFTTRKLINTNGNVEGIFSSVNFRGLLSTKIFPRYIPIELPWEKNLKQSKKRWRVIFTDGKFCR
jgi:hypothetical protein